MVYSFDELTVQLLFHFFLLFCRIGSAVMLLNGIGEIYVMPRVRLLFALALSAVVFPVLEPSMPPVPTDVLALALIVAGEIMIGLLIGGITRILQGVLHVAGMIIAFQSSLASALLFDANQGSQGSVIGNFMTLLGMTLLFITGLHHVVLQAIVQSYHLFAPGSYPPINDFAKMATTTLSHGFLVAFQISSPLIVVGLCIYLGAGLLGRLMPNMQVFFVLIPVQIYISFIILVLTLSVGMMWYLNYYEEAISNFYPLDYPR